MTKLVGEDLTLTAAALREYGRIMQTSADFHIRHNRPQLAKTYRTKAIRCERIANDLINDIEKLLTPAK